MISYHKIPQNAARIARTVFNVSICRTFMRSVSFITTTRGDGFIDRSL
jgi:hypothetical protein